MGHWVLVYCGCPDGGDFQEVSRCEEPALVWVRERRGSPGVAEGFVRESLDDLMLVARYRWVTSGEPAAVVAQVLQECGLWPLPVSEGRPRRAV